MKKILNSHILRLVYRHSTPEIVVNSTVVGFTFKNSREHKTKKDLQEAFRAMI